MAQLPHSPGFSSSPRTGKFKPCIARRRSQVVRQRSAKSLCLFLCCPPISGRVHAARTYALPFSDCPQICPHLLERLSDVVSEGGFARMGVFKSPSNVVATQRPRRRPCLNDVPGYCEKP